MHTPIFYYQSKIIYFFSISKYNIFLVTHSRLFIHFILVKLSVLKFSVLSNLLVYILFICYFSFYINFKIFSKYNNKILNNDFRVLLIFICCLKNNIFFLSLQKIIYVLLPSFPDVFFKLKYITKTKCFMYFKTFPLVFDLNYFFNMDYLVVQLLKSYFFSFIFFFSYSCLNCLGTYKFYLQSFK
jgi:hypothetical protein